MGVSQPHPLLFVMAEQAGEVRVFTGEVAGGGKQGGRSEGEELDQDTQQQRTVERSNLLNLTKLVVKALVEASMRSGQPLRDGSTPLRHLFVILEQVMSHRLRGEI